MIIEVDKEMTAHDISINLQQAIFTIQRWPFKVPKKEWWGHAKACPKCKEKYERRKEWVDEYNMWWEAYCLRHAPLFSALWDLYNLSRVVVDKFIPDNIYISVFSNNHDITANINKERAIVTMDERKFTYKNHTNAYPYMSSYAVLIRQVVKILKELKEYLEAEPKERWCAVVIKTPQQRYVLSAGETIEEHQHSVSCALSKLNDC